MHRIAATATIVAGFLVIAFEIENSWRMPVGNVIGANPTSNIWWMGTLYGAYLFFMMIEFVMLQKEQHKTATMFGLAGLLVGWEEGLELNLLGLTVGVDLTRPALKLPGIGRLGMR